MVVENLVSSSDVQYSEYSVMDSFGRVFTYQNKIYRGIYEDSKQNCIDFLNSDLYKELIELGYFPKTTVSDLKLEGFSLILEHEKLPSSQPSEWSFSMIKDATLFLLDLKSICAKHGYKLKDGHLYNILFKNNRPVFVDLGSIVKSDNSNNDKSFSNDFLNICVIPLILYSMGERYLAHAILSSGCNIYDRLSPDCSLLNSPAFQKVFKKFLKEKLNMNCINIYLNRKKPDILLKNFLTKENIEKCINWDECKQTMWENYQYDFFKEVKEGNINFRFERFKKIEEYIKKHSPDAKSVCDLAGNQGGMCYYLEQNNPNITELINVDYDEIAIENSFKILKELDSKTQTYLLNFMLPKRKTVTVDFKADVVLALAITHHLILSQRFLINYIFETVKKFSKKYVYIEFMPWGLWGGGEEKPEVPDWYTEDWFETNFKKHFKILHKELISPNRMLFIGEKIEKN